jgi:hypothetical protein
LPAFEKLLRRPSTGVDMKYQDDELMKTLSDEKPVSKNWSLFHRRKKNVHKIYLEIFLVRRNYF